MAFTVDVERIQAASADIDRIAADIESAVARMTSMLTSLQSSWTGVASVEFHSTMADWRVTQTRVRDDLAAIGALTARAGTSYQATEDGVRGLFAR